MFCFLLVLFVVIVVIIIFIKIIIIIVVSISSALFKVRYDVFGGSNNSVEFLVSFVYFVPQFLTKYTCLSHNLMSKKLIHNCQNCLYFGDKKRFLAIILTPFLHVAKLTKIILLVEENFLLVPFQLERRKSSDIFISLQFSFDFCY